MNLESIKICRNNSAAIQEYFKTNPISEVFYAKNDNDILRTFPK